MISLLYTGALVANQQQLRGASSIGGYTSITPIPNGRLNSLFSDICYYQQENTECRLISILIGDIAVENVKIWIENTDPLISYELALIFPTIDSCGNKCFEKLTKSSDIPLYGNFIPVNSEDAHIYLGSIIAGQVIGLWIKRIYDRNTQQGVASRSCEYLSTLNTNNEINVIERSFNLIIDFN